MPLANDAPDSAISDSERFVQDLIEASPDCLKVLDTDGRLLRMNGMGLCLMEIDDIQPFVGADWPSFWPGEGEQMARSAVEEALNGMPAGFLGPCPTAKGSPKWWDVRVFPVFDVNQRVVRLVSVSRDITAQREAEEALRQANETLEARVAERTAELERLNATLHRHNRTLQEFAFVSSHDLQEPLRRISTYADLLKQDYAGDLPDEARHFVERMHASARRMSDLVRGLRDFANTLQDATAPTPVSMETVWHEVRASLDAEIVDANASLVVDGPLPTLLAYPAALRQLLHSLVVNALVFRRSGVSPVVTVRSRALADTVTVEVGDNGRGFDMMHAERVFVPFQRLHVREGLSGTGVGLALVRSIAERHGATVEVESIEGQGSRFVVAFPASRLVAEAVA